MNTQQVLSVTRDLLQIIGTFLTTYGLINQGQWEPIAGGILMIVPVIWGIYSHTPANAVAAVAALRGTVVDPAGRAIELCAPELKQAAVAAATDVHGKP